MGQRIRLVLNDCKFSLSVEYGKGTLADMFIVKDRAWVVFRAFEQQQFEDVVGWALAVKLRLTGAFNRTSAWTFVFIRLLYHKDKDLYNARKILYRTALSIWSIRSGSSRQLRLPLVSVCQQFLLVIQQLLPCFRSILRIRRWRS